MLFFKKHKNTEQIEEQRKEIKKDADLLIRKYDTLVKEYAGTYEQNQRLFKDYQKALENIKMLKSINKGHSVNADADALYIDRLEEEKKELIEYNERLSKQLDEATSEIVTLINELKKNGITNIPEGKNERTIKLDTSEHLEQSIKNNGNGRKAKES